MKKILSLIILSMFLFSCEKLFFDKEISSKSPQVNFDYLWQKCYENYSFFEYKNIDWHEVKIRYQSKIDKSMSNEELFTVLADMLRELRDAHTNLYSNLNISFFPIQKLGPDNFEWRTITDNYLPSNYQITGPFRHDYIKNHQIGYIRYASFMGEISDAQLDYILKRYANTDGLIIDIRENGGGAAANVFKLLSRFIDDKTLVYFSRYKNGPEPNNFSDFIPAYIEPSEKTRYLNKVMLLTDRSTYSAGSFTTLAAKAINNITIIGDTTGGGLGIPNGGQIPNGWTYRFSVSQAVDLNQNNYEDGVPPDIISYFDWSNLNIDEVIERAIQEINN
jgi:hypothetical protein